MRVGIGYDAHRLVEGRPLVLGGVEIPYRLGLEGWSDADVLLHAIIDAMLGAAAAGDIGEHFPDADPAYRGISSLKLLALTRNVVEDKGFTLSGVDSVVILQEPSLRAHRDRIRECIAEALLLPFDRVSVKAKTSEGMGFTGRGEGIAAYAVVLLEG
ncbi:MAG: 2-C-methyl-D-erythritol 2,4-cyclodiphosphate synthase [Actinobacteria bacterium]|nr:2-C-methyl-D-erythritol 2,4-cyclodiphosphate synthase [Actinomycetota bacterium]